MIEPSFNEQEMIREARLAALLPVMTALEAWANTPQGDNEVQDALLDAWQTARAKLGEVKS